MTKLWIKTCDSVKIILYLNQYFDSKKRDDYTVNRIWLEKEELK